MPTPTALLIQLCRSNITMQLFRCVTMQAHVLTHDCWSLYKISISYSRKQISQAFTRNSINESDQ